MSLPYIKSLKLNGFLSFSREAEQIELGRLNLVIGPNGSGKSNLIESLQLLAAIPHDFASAIRRAGGVDSLLWQGKRTPGIQVKDAQFQAQFVGLEVPDEVINYQLVFTSNDHCVQLVKEEIHRLDQSSDRDKDTVILSYHHDENTIKIQQLGKKPRSKNKTDIGFIKHNQSILAQLKDQENYPTLYWLSEYLTKMQFFRGWSFGPDAPVRQPQRADDPTDQLLPDARNLALVVNELVLNHYQRQKFHSAMQKFLPRFERCALRISDGAPILYLHETGTDAAIPAARMSDGTLRFIAIVAALLAPTPPSMLCLEEPEIGMHPDALKLLAELLIEASQRMQIIVITHSEILLKALEKQVGAVLVCENDGTGTRLRHINPLDIKDWTMKYQRGELTSLSVSV